jgi:hypothetical protein
MDAMSGTTSQISAGNDVSGDVSSDVTGDESSGITNEGNSQVTSDQGAIQQQGATDAQSSTNLAQGATQTNAQNADAGNALQAAADQSNQNVEAAALAAALEKARHEEAMSAIGSFQ